MNVAGEKHAIVVEDDSSTAIALTKAIRSFGFTVQIAGSVAEARQLIERHSPELVLLDVKLPDGNGLELMQSFKSRFIVITGDATQDVAIRSLRLRADNFLLKPVSLTDLRSVVDAPGKDAVNDEHSSPAIAKRRRIESDEIWHGQSVNRDDVLLTGDSSCAKALNGAIQQLARANSNVLISGEPGVDKLSAAMALYRRKTTGSVLCQVQCATGHIRFNGRLIGNEFSSSLAKVFSPGRDQQPVTLVLDGIEDLADHHKQELLSYLTPASIVADSASAATPRIISIERAGWLEQPATDEQDATLRLCLAQFPLKVPALRHRAKDIASISQKLLQAINTRTKTRKVLTDDAVATLTAHMWPGNVRQLANTIARAHVVSPHLLDVDDIIHDNDDDSRALFVDALVGTTFWEIEKELLSATLRFHDGDKKASAKTLGISLKTLYNRMNAYDISL
jgi:DNA-binding NtrC family response regulator